MLMHLSFPLIFDRQHDHVLKKLNFDILTPPPRDGRERDLCVNICAHVAACGVPFYLISNMTIL